jgi:pseudaminic acid synthase
MIKHQLAIDGRLIGLDHPPYLIAELSGNHNGDINRAVALIRAAKTAGADAIKIQTYTADTITINHDSLDFRIVGGLWDGYTLYQLYQEAHTPWQWHSRLFAEAKDAGITIFSSPFDATAVDLLEELGTPCYKIASFENADLPLLKKVAKTGKPVILSTGMATLAELDEAVKTLRSSGCEDIILLKCTSTYPARPRNSNLQTIPHLRAMTGCEVGVSDHTLGIGVAAASVGPLGATVIEKHMTLARDEGGVDAAFSLEPGEFASLVEASRQAWEGLGEITYGATAAEKESLKFRRSIYVVEDIPAGGVLTERNMRIIRPGYGLHPRHYEFMLGKQLLRSVSRGEPLAWNMVTKDLKEKE